MKRARTPIAARPLRAARTRSRPASSVLVGLVGLGLLVGLVACTPAAAPAPEPTPVTVPWSPTPDRSTPPEPVVPDPDPDPLPAGAVNFLVLGTDSRDPASLTGNADTIVLVHLTADRDQVYLVSLTRDMWVAIPGLGSGKINSAFAKGGTDTLRATVSDLLGGIDIPYVVQSNFAGFIALTRALGGFEVVNKHHSTVTVASTGRVVDFPEGRIRLENTDALIYVRERKRLPLGDLDRTERQRAALVGMLEAVNAQVRDPQTGPALLAMLLANVKVTGLGTQDVTGLLPLVGALHAQDVVGLMVPITGFGTMNGASVNLVDEAQTAALGDALATDTMAQYVETYGTDYAP